MVKNRYALVCGASERIGRAVAGYLAGEGYHLSLQYYQDKAQVTETARATGAELVLQSDLRSEKSIGSMYESIYERFPSLDVVVNCASIFETQSFSEAGEESFSKNFDLHARGSYFLTRNLYRKEKEKGGRAVLIHFTDATASAQLISRPLYSLSKQALIHQIAPLARICAPEVRVNAIAPGLLIANNEKEQAYFERREQELPMRRLATLSDVLLTLQFFITNTSVTGQMIKVDGGEGLLVNET